MKTKGIERTVDKYLARVRVAGNDYKKGIASPKKSWAEGAGAAAETWKSAITEAAGRGAYAAGVSKAGDAKWKEMAEIKGTARFTSGVEAGQKYYRSGMQDVISVIEGVPEGTRGPAGSATNYEISKSVGDALHAWKISRGT